jgi:hypothetical protein
MIALDLPQGSIEWRTARLWRLTASNMAAVITSTGALSASKAAMAHIDSLIAGIELANLLNSQPERVADMTERELTQFISHYTGDKFAGSHHTQRGHDCEPDAIAALSAILGVQVLDVGMCIMGDSQNGVVSCSPDGIIHDSAGKFVAGAEVKSHNLSKYNGQVIDNVFPDCHTLQVHASMAICEVDEWHFGSFFTGKPLFHKIVTRSSYTDKIGESLLAFRSMYEERFHDLTQKMKVLTERSKNHEQKARKRA